MYSITNFHEIHLFLKPLPANWLYILVLSRDLINLLNSIRPQEKMYANMVNAELPIPHPKQIPQLYYIIGGTWL